MSQPQIVRYKSGKTTYEVLTKQGTVLKYRKKQIGSLDNVLMSEEVF
jgi:ribosome maturation protein Sdo1